MAAFRSETINSASWPLAGGVRRIVVFIGLAGALAACAESTAVEPNTPSAAAITSGSSTAAPTPTSSGNVVPAFKTPSGPAHIYQETGSLYSFIYVMHGLLISRYVLYDDGTFELQFAGMPGYTGRYTRADSSVDFTWDGWSGAGPWGSTAFVRDDDLTVQYNNVMLMTDFMDGTYHRVHD